MALWSQSVKEWSGVHSLWRTEIDRQKSENCQFQLNALPRPTIEMMKNFQFIFFLPLYHSTPAIMMKTHLFNSEKSFIYVHERLNILIIKLNAFMLALCFHWNDFFFVVSSSHSSCSLMSESFSHHHQKMGALFVAGFPLRSNQSYQIISNFNKWKLSPLENIIKSFTDDSSDAMEAISNMKANEVFYRGRGRRATIDFDWGEWKIHYQNLLSQLVRSRLFVLICAWMCGSENFERKLTQKLHRWADKSFWDCFDDWKQCDMLGWIS